MKKWWMLFVCLTISIFAASRNPPPPQRLAEIREFQGDQHGEYRGDFVAVLSDGSGWKIHPKDRELFSRWQLNEPLQVGMRTSHYWFKRQHKFYLRNTLRNEEARVMIVEYPALLLTISLSQVNQIGGTLVPTYWTDAMGHRHFHYQTRAHYEKKLILNNGSVWSLHDQPQFTAFATGAKVYLSFDSQHEEIGFFLITGLEREANSAKLYW